MAQRVFEIYKHQNNGKPIYETEYQGGIIGYSKTEKEAYASIKEYTTTNGINNYSISQLNFE